MPNKLRWIPDRVCDVAHLSSLVPEELASVLDDLLVGQQAVGLLLAQREDLPQGDAERPHVAGRGELTLERTRKTINTPQESQALQ